ncbi:MAG: DUF6662 family protein [Chthoniobacterales bacterium]
MKCIPLGVIAAVGSLGSLAAPMACADEQFFGFARGSETLPQGHAEIYQSSTLRTGKDGGTYYGSDYETEVEYGFTDRFQASLSLLNHYFYNKDVDDLPDRSSYRFGGVEASGKYRFLSPFKDWLGLALRLEGGYLLNDEVGGLKQHERYLKPEIDFQKDFLDDTLATVFSLGVEWAWGKQPAEEYPREFSFESAGGITYRFAPNWYAGLEAHFRAEYPLFDLGFFEHSSVYAGPSLHYAQKRWWATLTWNYQVYGKGIDEPDTGQTFAEESRNAWRLKVGFNF